MILAAAAALFFALTTAFFLQRCLRYRSWWFRDTGRDYRPPPIPQVTLEEFVPRLVRTHLGPTRDGDVCVVGAGDGAPGGTSDTEAIILAVLATDARVLFDFGTATGRTAYMWALNSPPDARVTTFLNTRHASLPLVRPGGASLVAYRAPQERDS